MGKVYVLYQQKTESKLILYNDLCYSDLLQWIERTIEALGDRTFANSLEGVRQQLLQFSNYRTVEKPPK